MKVVEIVNVYNVVAQIFNINPTLTGAFDYKGGVILRKLQPEIDELNNKAKEKEKEFRQIVQDYSDYDIPIELPTLNIEDLPKEVPTGTNVALRPVLNGDFNEYKESKLSEQLKDKDGKSKGNSSKQSKG